MHLANGQKFRQYEIVEQVGEGGMGVVYEARDLRLKRKVALKLIHGRLGEGADPVRRLLREAESAAALNHPHIAHVYEADEEGGVGFLAMEFLPGGSLRDRMERGPLGTDEILRCTIEVAEALAEAHRHNIVHRDIKPSNVLFDERGRAKICDFGIAKRVVASEDKTASRLTAEGVVLGTPAYMSPEQLRGKPVSPATDTFALCCVIYEMATGRHPFERGNTIETLNAIMKEPPRPLEGSGVSPELEQFIQQCLDKNPDSRPDDAVLLARLGAMARKSEARSEAPTVAGPTTRARVARPRLMLPIAASVVAGLGLLTWWLWPEPTIDLSAQDVVLLSGIENQSGDLALEGTLATALRMSLEQSAHVNLLSPERVNASLRRMRRQGDERLTEELAREVAVREGARALLAGSIAVVGNEWLLDVRIIEPETGNTLRTFTERARSREEILDAVDALARTLRRALGESLASVVRSSTPLDEATTSSLEALRNFSDGNRLFRRGQRDEARALFERAIELDPDFARAYASLASAHAAYATDLTKAEQYFQQALKRIDHVTERERLEIQALYHGAMGRHAEAVSSYRLLVERYPGVDWYHYNLAHAYQDLRQYQDAIARYQEALRLNPGSASALINVATCSVLLGEPAEAVPYYDRAFELEPDWKTDATLNHEYGWTLLRASRPEAAREAFELMLAKSGVQKARGHRSLGLLALYRGQIRDARRELEEASRLHELSAATDSAARDLLYLGEALVLLGRRPDGVKELDRASTFLEEAGYPALLTLRASALYSRTGRIDEAARLLEVGRPETERFGAQGRADLYRAEGEILLARSDIDGAVEKLSLARSSSPWILTESSLALALARAERGTEAIEIYEKLVRSNPSAWEGQVAWAVAHANLAYLYEQAGQENQARATYAKLAEIWKEADPDLEPLRLVRESMDPARPAER